jgi:VanZ family protein
VAKRRSARILFVLWIVITIAALLLPTGKPPRLIQRGLDKTIHTGLFTIMGILGQAAFPWGSLLITVPLATGIEYIQRLIPTGREYSLVDLLSNLIGIGLGLIGYELASRLK